MAGHSYGGLTAVQAMAADTRVRAAIMIDAPAGWNGVVAPPTIHRPALMLQLTDPWPESAPQLASPHDTAVLQRAAHYSATDLCAFGAGQDLCGTIDADEAARASRGAVASWLDDTVRGMTMPRFVTPELEWHT